MKIVPDLTSIAGSFRGILLDAYGVFWGGNAFGFFPGAMEMMEKLVSQGKIVGVLSNATQLAYKEVDKLKKHGLIQGKHFHFFITSGEIMRSVFLSETLPFPTPRKTFWLFNGTHPKFSHEPIFEGSPYKAVDEITDADFIFISVPHRGGMDQIDPEIFRHDVAQIVDSKLPMVCTNPDQFAHEGMPPQLVVRQGSIGKLYEELGGHVFYMGKPQPRLFAEALLRFHEFGVTNQSEILMVGDTPETDIRGARNFGISSALITETGVMAERIAKKGMRALEEIPAQDRPNFFLQKFAMY